jgi:F-type H+-transporting ATPase subunit delta
MSTLIAKRYVKALLIDQDIKGAQAIYDDISTIASAYSDDRFISIITSVEINIQDKINLLSSFVDNISQNIQNLIKLLAQNKRLNIIPQIKSELQKEMDILTNNYNGTIYTNTKLDKKDIDLITQNFEKKFDTTLTLNQEICDYDGIKVEIDGLGVEISFSKQRLKSQMIEHILKAF